MNPKWFLLWVVVVAVAFNLLPGLFQADTSTGTDVSWEEEWLMNDLPLVASLGTNMMFPADDDDDDDDDDGDDDDGDDDDDDDEDDDDDDGGTCPPDCAAPPSL